MLSPAQRLWRRSFGDLSFEASSNSRYRYSDNGTRSVGYAMTKLIYRWRNGKAVKRLYDVSFESHHGGWWL